MNLKRSSTDMPLPWQNRLPAAKNAKAESFALARMHQVSRASPSATEYEGEAHQDRTLNDNSDEDQQDNASGKRLGFTALWRLGYVGQ